MILLDGKALSDTIKEELRLEVAKHVANGLRPPHLVAVLVGENPASQTYVANKVRACEYVGYRSTELRYDANLDREISDQKASSAQRRP